MLYMLSNTIKNALIDKFNFEKTREEKHVKDYNEDEEYNEDEDEEYNEDEDEEYNEDSSEEEPTKSQMTPTYTHALDNLETIIPQKTYKNIHVCMYKVNTQNMYPFIMFLLYKYENNLLNFFNLTNYANTIIDQTIITDIVKQFTAVFEDWQTDIEYKGFIEDNDELMLILKYKNDLYDSITKCNYQEKWWWLLPSEIINYKHVLHLDINIFATKFILEHNKLIFLYDPQGNVYETPEVGYYGNYYKKIAAVASLGLNRQGIYSSFGPYYYFSTYRHAMRNAIWNVSFKPLDIGGTAITIDEKGRYEKGGIVKFALFVGKTKMLMGRDLDNEDQSDISQELAKKNAFVKAMLKLRDSDSTWTKEYNSVRIGSHHIELKDSSVINTDPMIALKEYEQHVPLEYYYVDTSQRVETGQEDKAVIM